MKNLTGLTKEEVSVKLKEFGPNEIKEVGRVSAFQILFRQVKKNFIIYLLSATALISFVLGKEFTGLVILIVIAIVVVTGFIQEYKAEKAISALRSMIMPVSRVIRGGKEEGVASSELVPGDIVVLRTGEKVPADCVVLEQSNLKTNESVLTGESSDVEKTAAKSSSSYSDKSLLFMGSYIVNGHCLAYALHTGMNTKFGKIAGMISTADKHLPLQDKVNNISKFMVIIGLTAAFFTGFVLFSRADAITPDVIVGILIVVIALSVSSFPEGFPVVLITTLAAGVNRMAKQNAVVNRMSIIETLGETSVICSDKTGTLTKGEMTTRKIFSGGKFYDVSGVGYKAEGEITEDGKSVDPGKIPPLEKLIKCAVICNDSNLEKQEDSLYKIVGSSTEGSLLVLGAKLGIFKENFPNSRIEEMPFDSVRKMMSVLYPEDGQAIAYVKGAPESVLFKCSSVETNEGIRKFTEEEKKEILKINRTLASSALRSLALAYKPASSKAYKEEGLVFLGLVGMEDAPREEVAEAISLCGESGIKVKMVTGDNKETAEAIARQLGIEGETLTGVQMDDLSDEELVAKVNSIGIFARVKPEDKLRIVRALKANKEIVTMTGDGVNDAPALKEAHIGVAMGITGTDVSRSVADITLKDDNFATIVAAIKEGRTVFNNIRKFLTYQLSCNLSDIYILFVGMVLAPLLGWYVPIISALQILFMNIVTDNIPAITLGFNPTSKDIMKEKPRKNTQILTGEFIQLIIFNGISMGIIAFAVAYLSFNVIKFPPEVARTTVLVSMILTQIANAYNFRSFRYRVLNRGIFVNKYLFFATLISFAFTLAIIYTPLRTLFETTTLGIESWIIAAGAALSITILFDIQKTINNRTNWFLSARA